MAKTKGAKTAKKRSAKRTSAKATAAPRKRTSHKATAKKPAAKKAPAAGPSKTSAKSPKSPTKVKTAPKRAAAKRKGSATKRPAGLGRPKIAATAELDQMFLKDYEARQVFAFLGVKTVKELEEHPPAEIIERLTGPMVRAVDRIRKALAVNNRYLAGDQKFAVQFTRQLR